MNALKYLCIHLTNFYFIETYRQANDFVTRRRNVGPANYNADRLNEMPIPYVPDQSIVDSNLTESSGSSEDEDIANDNGDAASQKSTAQGATNGSNSSGIGEQNNSNDLEDVSRDDESNDEDGHRIAATHETTVQGATNGGNSGIGEQNNNSNDFEDVSPNDESNVQHAEPFEEVTVEGAPSVENNINAIANTSQIDMKPDIMVLQHIAMENFNSMVDVLDDDEDVVEIDDEMTITFARSKGFAMPLAATDGLIKRENDLMTGNVPFYTNVS